MTLAAYDHAKVVGYIVPSKKYKSFGKGDRRMVDRWMGQSALDCKGYRLRSDGNAAPTEVCARVLEQLGLDDLLHMVIVEGGRDDQGTFVTMRMRPQYVHQWAPCLDTLKVASILQLDTVGNVQDLTPDQIDRI